MKAFEKYPYISFLISVSTAVFVIGVVFFAYFNFLNQPNKREHSSSAIGKQPPLSKAKVEDEPTSSVNWRVGRASTTYYSRTDDTISRTEYLPLYNDKGNRFNMQAFFENKGREIYTPDNISLRVVVVSTKNIYSADRRFEIYLNGQSVLFSENSILENSDAKKGVVTTSLIQVIPFEVFVKMSKASKLEMQIGPTKIKLRENDIQAFRDLINLIED